MTFFIARDERPGKPERRPVQAMRPPVIRAILRLRNAAAWRRSERLREARLFQNPVRCEARLQFAIDNHGDARSRMRPYLVVAAPMPFEEETRASE